MAYASASAAKLTTFEHHLNCLYLELKSGGFSEYMSYQVIARKWRPKNFEELVGQNHIAQTLINALKSDRLPHAVLFTGPRGTGKTSTARILAKSIRCPNAVDFIPCGVCKECEDISQGRSFDVHELDGASNNGVDAIRDLQEGVRSMPSSGKYKLYIIDEVHMLSISAFNALLKTLEEPPPHVIFVMATTEVQKIPNTILSRCQRFDFRRISVRQVAEHLKLICSNDGVEADEESLWIIARQGGGSMRDSQSLLDQVITYTDGQLQHERVIEVLGLTDRSLLLDALKALSQRSSEGALDVIERIFQSGHDSKVFAEDLLEELRHLLLVKLNPDQASQVVDLPESEIEALAEMGISLSEEDVHLLFDMTLKGVQDIARASDPRLVLEMLLLRMAAAPKVESLTSLLRSGGAANPGAPAKKKMTSTARPVTPPAPPVRERTNGAAPVNRTPQKPIPPRPTPKAAAATFDASKSAEENWFQFVQSLKSKNALMAAQLENTHVLSFEGNELMIGLAKNLEFLYEQISSKDFLSQLTEQIRGAWKKDLTIKIKVANPGAQTLSPKQAEEKKIEEKKKQTWQSVESHPLVKATQEKLNVKIESIKESK